MKNKLTLKKIFTIFVVLLPFLYQYKSPITVISLGEFILIPFMIYFFMKDFSTKLVLKQFNGLYTYLLCVLIFNLIASIQTYYSYSDFATIFARIVYYSILIYIAYNNFDFKYGIKFLINISILFSVYAIIQTIAYYTLDVILPTVVNPNWVFAGEESGNRLNYAEYYKWMYRASSLFLEPGYYISYAAPALLALLHLDGFNKKNMLRSLIITIGFIVSTSSAAIVILVVAWGTYFLKDFFGKNKKYEIKKIILSFGIIIIVCVLLNSGVLMSVINRIAGGGSFNNRITRTFIIFKNTNVFQKIVGVGVNNVANFINQEKLYTMYDEADLNYISSYIGTLLSSGIITFLFYNKFFITSFCKSRQIFTKLLVTIFLFYNFIGNITFSNKFAFYAILIFATQKFYSINNE